MARIGKVVVVPVKALYKDGAAGLARAIITAVQEPDKTVRFGVKIRFTELVKPRVVWEVRDILRAQYGAGLDVPQKGKYEVIRASAWVARRYQCIGAAMRSTARIAEELGDMEVRDIVLGVIEKIRARVAVGEEQLEERGVLALRRKLGS